MSYWLIPISLFVYDLFILRFPLIDAGDVVSESEKYIWLSIWWFLIIESFKLWSSCIALVSDSETEFLRFENRFWIICFCLLIISCLSVCQFVLMYPIVCLCGLTTRLYLSSLTIQLCNIIVCLFPKLSLDVRFGMMDARLRLVVSNALNCWFLQFLRLA